MKAVLSAHTLEQPISAQNQCISSVPTAAVILIPDTSLSIHYLIM